MGTIYRADCPSCGYSRDFFLGGGLGSIKPRLMMKGLGEAERAFVEDLLDRDGIRSFMAENRLVEACPCMGGHGPEQRLVVRLTDADGREHRLGTRCEACGAELRAYTSFEEQGGPPADVPCPQCGAAGLRFAAVGLWD